MFAPYKTEKTVAPVSDPFSLDALIAWLRTKPVSAAYDYGNPENCAICQYLREVVGFSQPRVTMDGFRNGLLSNDRKPLPKHWERVVVQEPHTFEAALDRALAIRARAK